MFPYKALSLRVGTARKGDARTADSSVALGSLAGSLLGDKVLNVLERTTVTNRATLAKVLGLNLTVSFGCPLHEKYSVIPTYGATGSHRGRSRLRQGCLLLWANAYLITFAKKS